MLLLVNRQRQAYGTSEEIITGEMECCNDGVVCRKLNPKIRGWVNYYAKFGRWKALRVFRYLNGLIVQWIKHAYKIIGIRTVLNKYRTIQAEKPDLFYHWRLGIK